jgi:hypothetical protein
VLKNKIVLFFLVFVCFISCGREKNISQKDFWYFSRLGADNDLYFRFSKPELSAIKKLRNVFPVIKDFSKALYLNNKNIFSKTSFVFGASRIAGSVKSTRLILKGQYSFPDFNLKNYNEYKDFAGLGIYVHSPGKGFSSLYYKGKSLLFVFSEKLSVEKTPNKQRVLDALKSLRGILDRNTGSWLVIKNIGKVHENYLKEWNLLALLKKCSGIVVYFENNRDENSLVLKAKIFFPKSANMGEFISGIRKIYDDLVSKYSEFKKRFYDYNSAAYKKHAEIYLTIKTG